VFSSSFNSCRYLPFPITLPTGSWVFRGIGTRLDEIGSHLCDEATASLLTRGCGPADLTRVPPNAANIFGALWLKVGQTFTSAALEKALGYTSMPERGALVAIRAEYFHVAQRSGRCRVEKEHWFNPVFYDPIPHNAIDAIWLPKSMEASVQAAAADASSPNLASSTQGTLRQVLRASGHPASTTFLDRLHFVEANADMAHVVSEACPPATAAASLCSTLVELLLCIEIHQQLSKKMSGP